MLKHSIASVKVAFKLLLDRVYRGDKYWSGDGEGVDED